MSSHKNSFYKISSVYTLLIWTKTTIIHEFELFYDSFCTVEKKRFVMTQCLAEKSLVRLDDNILINVHWKWTQPINLFCAKNVMMDSAWYFNENDLKV